MPQLRIASVTESYRASGEDRLALDAGEDRCIIALADGMGGRAGGAAAAELCVACSPALSQSQRNVLDTEYWCQRLIEADRKVRDDRAAGETTAVILAVTRDGVAGASVGDSGTWIITADRIFDLTAAQVRKPGIGTGMAQPVGFRAGRLFGTLLVASDGLWKYTSPQVIAGLVRSVELAGLPKALVDAVRLPSGALQDDIAVAVCRWDPPTT